ncbi:phosphate signaling complex protein PhoU [Paenibacillus motobuensis]|uniref:phosphate signaling complex protein PhoU n=1 Tax=Paenibacillus TaxID=44249 RepID=UPI002042649C|nr:MULTISPECIES: phosphate signaling complex protein PhoU [Paenibacillus]MCM3038621.1 phosphate signaling complex protein PhoU [Paenibacillus lutimineralis]MCM3645725.1 phosphate signaling complex protein PhoU [Paenibacillus motobuensis]
MIQRREFDQNLNELRELLQKMGEHVEHALVEAVAALKSLDSKRAKDIIDRDRELNQMEEQVMEIGSRLIVTQQPVAKDLRRILVAFRISSDLERMGDLAIDIAKVTLRLEGQTLIKPLVDIPKLAELVVAMIQESLQSYLDENTDLAYKMAKDDDEVDHLYSQTITDLYKIIIDHPESLHQAMSLTLVGRYIERIADHATNIGESAVYLVTGHRPDLNH